MTANRTEAYEIINADGTGPAVILCEHASNHIPADYDGLGLEPSARDSHAAWDPGAEDLARRLSEALDAPMIAGRISRLIYDCNRPPEAPSAMPERTETIAVPGNVGLDEAARAARVARVYAPFTRATSDLIARRGSADTPFALITVHSFTPRWMEQPRAVEIGILHDTDARLADAMLAQEAPGRQVERNAPYGPADGVTHSLCLHGIANNLPNVMLEIRNDLIATPAQQDRIAAELLGLLRPALARLKLGEAHDA
ncbi:N-formylglutamate amidohydrolase [Roseovarius sp. A-2]|uniref:N-formylglutamate amidohydrolase n=1 Tax=Roseovarius sp. A-2 TaxID=1570360 RepID=UPI0009B53EF2|nr:N-formylglutamate amidohydrolase [Roseovarius sp. A-2]GAW34263.1 N-formylglutamate amidohydrolase [Roseovarius sp. A-2]